MKRWTKKDIELLKLQSEQSRNGETITPGNGISGCKPTRARIGRVGNRLPKNTIAIPLENNPDFRLEVRIKKPRRSDEEEDFWF